MSPTAAGIAGMAALLVLLFLRMPIGIAMALVGAVGIAVLNTPDAALHVLGSYPFSYAAVQALSVIPLFVLMGHFADGLGHERATSTPRPTPGSATGAAGSPSPRSLACAGFAALSRLLAWPRPITMGTRGPAARCAATATTRASRPAWSPPAARSAS